MRPYAVVVYELVRVVRVPASIYRYNHHHNSILLSHALHAAMNPGPCLLRAVQTLDCRLMPSS